MGRKKNKHKHKPEICDDRGFVTISMTQEELMIAINPSLTKKQKNKLIHRLRHNHSDK